MQLINFYICCTNIEVMETVIVHALYCIIVRQKIKIDFMQTFSGKEANMEESYMTVKEFCNRLQVSQSTVYRMIKERQIPAIKFGRYWKTSRSIFKTLN